MYMIPPNHSINSVRMDTFHWMGKPYGRKTIPPKIWHKTGAQWQPVLQQMYLLLYSSRSFILFCSTLCLTLKYELLLDSPIYSSLCSQCLAFSRCSVNISSTGPLRKDQEFLVWLLLPLKSRTADEPKERGLCGDRERGGGGECLLTPAWNSKK